jgi:hypothetical protein
MSRVKIADSADPIESNVLTIAATTPATTIPFQPEARNAFANNG